MQTVSLISPRLLNSVLAVLVLLIAPNYVAAHNAHHDTDISHHRLANLTLPDVMGFNNVATHSFSSCHETTGTCCCVPVVLESFQDLLFVHVDRHTLSDRPVSLWVSPPVPPPD